MQSQCYWKLFPMFAINTGDALFLSQVSSQARISSQALSEIESRHQDIICLESSIKELHEIFVDTAMLLEIQVRWLPHLDGCKGDKLNLADADYAYVPSGGSDQQHREERDKCCRVRRHFQR